MASINISLHNSNDQSAYFCFMSFRIFFVSFIAAVAVFKTNTIWGQATRIDTIVVNLTNEQAENENENKPPTPLLDLDKMRNQIKADSARMASENLDKSASEKKREEGPAKKQLAEEGKMGSTAPKILRTDSLLSNPNEVEKKAFSAEKNATITEAPKGLVQQDNIYGTVRLAYDENTASFLLSIPTETKMHFHKEHSEHILLIEGEGMVLLGYKTIKLKKNELVFVTKGTPHKIINSGKSNLKVLSIQSPFYDGSDIIILE